MRCNNVSTYIRPGHVLSNEPGFYEGDKFGIRIENIMMVVKAKTKNNRDSAPFYGFENVTMVPYCRNLLDLALLSGEEKDWVNERNPETSEKIQHLVEDDEVGLALAYPTQNNLGVSGNSVDC